MNIEFQDGKMWMEYKGKKIHFTVEALLELESLKEIKEIVTAFMEKCRAHDFDLRESKYHIAQLFYDLDKVLGVKN